MSKTNYNPYSAKQRSGETLIQQYKRLTKIANRRLDRLEDLEQQQGFETATKWSYGRAMQDIKELGGRNNRFTSAIPYEYDAKTKSDIADTPLIRQRVKAMEKFISSASSTKSGIIEVYKNKADTINSKYGTDFTWQEFARYYESGQAMKANRKYGSKTVLRAIAEIQKHLDGKELTEDVRQSLQHNIKVDDEVVGKAVQGLLRKNSGIKMTQFID